MAEYIEKEAAMLTFYQPFSCSVCLVPNTFMGKSNYCPACGAKMNGGADDEM